MRVLLVLCAALLAQGCTPGAVAAPSGGGGPVTLTIDVSLTSHSASSTPYGQAGGYAPAVASVAVGSTIRFINSDSFAHTATMVPGSTFPSGSPIGSSAQTPSGSQLSGVWSSGTLAAGQSSQTFVADRAGTYLYGCFFHYGAPMRGAIVAQ